MQLNCFVPDSVLFGSVLTAGVMKKAVCLLDSNLSCATGRCKPPARILQKLKVLHIEEENIIWDQVVSSSFEQEGMEQIGVLQNVHIE